MNITVYTAILDDYDNLRPPEVVEEGVDYVCFSDEYHDCFPWRIVPAPQPRSDARFNSRIPKILSHCCVHSDYSIYSDACLTPSCKPSQLIAEMLGETDLALYRHPCRSNLADEVEVCRRHEIGYGPQMVKQVERYYQFGYRSGLYAGGVVIRRNTKRVMEFNQIWWREFLHGCPRDQIALAWAVHESRIPVRIIESDILQDPFRFKFVFHAGFSDQAPNIPFNEKRQFRTNRRNEIRSLCK